MTPGSQRVLVTGAAAGIGRATVETLLAADHQVVALDVDAAGLEGLPDAVETHAVDVTDERAVEETVADRALDAVVTCAGVASLAAVEDTDRGSAERQFRTNVFGTLSVVRAALPALRERGGRVVLVSSVFGRFAMPFYGTYAATKHALEAYGDALRMELGGFDVDVTVLQPGPVRTGFNERALSNLPDDPDSAYAAGYDRVRREYDAGGVAPERVAAAVRETLAAADPPARRAVTWQAWLLPRLRVLLPTPVFDRLVTARLLSDGPLGTVVRFLRG